MKPFGDKRGFTLVELMVAGVAASILALAMSLVLVMVFRALRTNNDYARLRRDMALAVDWMARDLREASYRISPREGLSFAENRLTVSNNTVRADITEYRRDAAAGSLVRFVNGAAQGPVVMEGLQRFHVEANALDGVVLHLEMANRGGDVRVACRTFIHARN